MDCYSSADALLERRNVGVERLEAKQQVDRLRHARVAAEEEALREDVRHVGELPAALHVGDELAEDGAHLSLGRD